MNRLVTSLERWDTGRSMGHPAARRAGLVFCAALGARLALAFLVVPLSGVRLGPRDPEFFTDTDGYMELATNLRDHGRLSFTPDARPTLYRAPGFPAVLAIGSSSGLSMSTTVLLVNAIAGALTCSILDATARQILGYTLPLPWALFLVLYPTSLYFGLSSFSDVFFALTVAAYLFCLLRLFETPTLGWGVSTGLALTASVLTKAILLPVPLMFVGYAALRRRTALAAALVALVVGWAALTPWVLRNYSLSGRLVPVTAGAGFSSLVGTFMVEEGRDAEQSYRHGRRRAVQYAVGREGPDAYAAEAEMKTAGHLDLRPEQDDPYARAVRELYRQRPGLLAWKVVVNTGRFFYFSTTPAKSLATGLIHLPTLGLGVVALWRCRRRSRVPVEVFSLFALAFVGLYAAVIVASPRYALPVMVALAAVAGGAVRQESRSSEDAPERASVGSRRQRQESLDASGVVDDAIDGAHG